ncbi:Protein of unknown function [Pyronema omphalodes CBS 100304]|uniref:Uncharacterized protein n=1 Tax=Pyronema omphalodes (strain CBS 100304) TaxID=1076935 RepID=U4L520_PYROM|nr:Protein of unknown function [Pyronema omphalodes CBS 100304]
MGLTPEQESLASTIACLTLIVVVAILMLVVAPIYYYRKNMPT